MKGIIFMQEYIKQIDNVLVGERIRKLREQFLSLIHILEIIFKLLLKLGLLIKLKLGMI